MSVAIMEGPKSHWISLLVFFSCVCVGLGSVVNFGVVFEWWGKLAFSSQTHTVGLVLDTSNISRQLDNLSDIVLTTGTIAGQNRCNLTKYFVAEVEKIASNINDTRLDVSDFLQSFSETSRQKRSNRFSNRAGYVVGSSLGLATDSEINDLVSQINAEHTHTYKVLNKFISSLDVTGKQLHRFRMATNKIELASQGLTHHINQSDMIMASLDADIVLSQTLNFLAIAAMNLQSEVAKMLNALENQVETFRLSPVFLPPNELIKILRVLQDQDDVRLLFPASPKFLSSFYDVSKVIVRKSGTQFLFLVRIPLKSDQLMFDLFRLTPLWHSAPNSSAWSRRVEIENDYLAVTQDSTYFTPLKDLGQCVGSRSLTVCTPKYGFSNPRNTDCIMSLYKNYETVSSLCSFSFKADYSPSFVKVGNSWISSSPSELQANEVCPKTNPRMITIPAGISKIPANDSCQIVGDLFKLPSFIASQHENNDDINIIPLTDFPVMPSPLELKDTLKILHLEKMDSFTHTQIALLASQSKTTPQKLFPYRNTIIAILITLILLGLFTIGKCIFSTGRMCSLSYLRSRRERPNHSDKKPADKFSCQVPQVPLLLNPNMQNNPPRLPTRPAPRRHVVQPPRNLEPKLGPEPEPQYEDMVTHVNLSCIFEIERGVTVKKKIKIYICWRDGTNR